MSRVLKLAKMKVSIALFLLYKMITVYGVGRNSNGNIYKVNAKLGKVVEIRNHSELMVGFVDLDFEYRVVWWFGKHQDMGIIEDDVEENASDLSDDTSSDDETTLVGLSKEELLDELDKDLSRKIIKRKKNPTQNLSKKKNNEGEQQKKRTCV
nr:BPK_HP1_G0058340.mRNA.1.CDS.1 [Saccharomyces cerevisiae]